MDAEQLKRKLASRGWIANNFTVKNPINHFLGLHKKHRKSTSSYQSKNFKSQLQLPVDNTFTITINQSTKNHGSMLPTSKLKTRVTQTCSNLNHKQKINHKIPLSKRYRFNQLEKNNLQKNNQKLSKFQGNLGKFFQSQKKKQTYDEVNIQTGKSLGFNFQQQKADQQHTKNNCERNIKSSHYAYRRQLMYLQPKFSRNNLSKGKNYSNYTKILGRKLQTTLQKEQQKSAIYEQLGNFDLSFNPRQRDVQDNHGKLGHTRPPIQYLTEYTTNNEEAIPDETISRLTIYHQGLRRPLTAKVQNIVADGKAGKYKGKKQNIAVLRQKLKYHYRRQHETKKEVNNLIELFPKHNMTELL